jgi:hypothetical protein
MQQKAFGTSPFLDKTFLTHYEEALQENAISVAVLDDSRFELLIDINERFQVATIACPQNLESLDWGLADAGQKRQRKIRSRDLAHELGILSKCSERLFISKAETALVGGCGLPAHYYPYVPVGQIRRWAEDVRRRRQQGSPEHGLFLMIGSAVHPPTFQAFHWFVQHALTNGLPKGVRVVVIGRGTNKLLPDKKSVPGLEIRGWVEQSEMEQLLVSSWSVLVPQFQGLGSLTRLPELASAGVPVLVSRHPTLALDVPPNASVVPVDTWEQWCNGIQAMMTSKSYIDNGRYTEWERAQPNPWPLVAHKWIK